MKILGAKINWMEEFDNLPDLEVRVDELPSREHLRYKTNDGAYWAENDGYVDFFYHVPKNQTGYGGRVLSGILENGEPFAVKGPWSSNAMDMNRMFPPSVSVVYRTSDQGVGLSGAIRAKLFWDLVIQAGGDVTPIFAYSSLGAGDATGTEIDWTSDTPVGSYDLAIRKPGMTLAQSQAYKRILRFQRYARQHPQFAPQHKEAIAELISSYGLHDWFEA